MNTQLENYLTLQERFNRIEQVIGGDWDTNYYLDKIVQPLCDDGFDVEDIASYITAKLYTAFDKAEASREPKTIKQVMKEHGR